jgi:hypothetical protein
MSQNEIANSDHYISFIIIAMPIIKDIIITCAAAIGAIVAILGLKTWRKELRGKTEYDLARNILRTTYRVRNAIQIVRNPWMTTSEYSPKTEPQDSNISENKSNDAVTYAYEKRWEYVSKALVDLDVYILEAEALWGSSILEKVKPLHKCVSILLANLNMYLRSLHDRRYAERLNDKFYEKVNDIIYSKSDDPEKDEFYKEVIDAVKGIETIVKPHLER